MTDTDIKTEDF